MQADTFVLGFSETSLACGGSRLTVLDLSDNCITDEGVSALANALQADGKISVCCTSPSEQLQQIWNAQFHAMATRLELSVTSLVKSRRRSRVSIEAAGSVFQQVGR